MECKYCGKDIMDLGEFCYHCGCKIEKGVTPQPLEDIDWTELIDQAKSYIDGISNGTHNEDGDYKHYMFDGVMSTVYGLDVWDYINKNTN